MLRFRVGVRELGFSLCLILFGAAEFLDRKDGRKPCISSLAAMTSVGNRKAEFASARQSVSVRRSTVQRSIVKRSMSGFGNAWYCGQYAGKTELFPASSSGIAISYSQISHEAPASEIAKWSRSHPDVSQRGRDIRDRGHPSAGSTR
ncbi:hypothetical protein SUGI_0876030 [Cryptomeria japonica]|nr:hypothetical protein SUGI_0876030 [Cryptomeria japonica]